jgi:periplasmic protein TonB
MTIAADPFARRDSPEFARWTACLLIVLALHGAAFLLIVRHRAPFEPVGLPPAAVIIDLAPAPPAAQPEVLPTPEPIPPQPEQLAPPEPEPVIPEIEPSPALHPPVVLPKPQSSKPKLKAKPVERPPVPQPIAPVPAVPAPVAPAAPAPSAPSNPNVRATWQAQLLSWLERHKRYPRVAQEQRQQGVARLHFALDRQGRVLSFRLDKSSGFTLLDEEVLELIQRAQPVPAPPPEIPGDRIEVLVPVAFSLKRAGF